MKFNVIRIGNRDFVDMGDLNVFLYDLSLKDKHLDKSTLATIVSADNYIKSKFAEKQPRENTLYEVSISDGIFYKELIRVLKENKKEIPKKLGDPLVIMDKEYYIEESCFTVLQIKQLQEELKKQNIELQKVFEEAVKKIQINVTAPTKPKTKAPA